jgi:hypothetical protein
MPWERRRRSGQAVAGRAQVSELDGKKVFEKLPNETLF